MRFLHVILWVRILRSVSRDALSGPTAHCTCKVGSGCDVGASDAHLCQACACNLQWHRDFILIVGVQVGHKPAAVVSLGQVRPAQTERLRCHGSKILGLSRVSSEETWQLHRKVMSQNCQILQKCTHTSRQDKLALLQHETIVGLAREQPQLTCSTPACAVYARCDKRHQHELSQLPPLTAHAEHTASITESSVCMQHEHHTAIEGLPAESHAL